jgi:hypothetical protein
MKGSTLWAILTGLMIILSITQLNAPTTARAEEGCEFLVCTTGSDCGRQCFCNNPYGCQGCGLCIKDDPPIYP